MREKMQVFDIAWDVGSDNKLVTCGVKHIKVSLGAQVLFFNLKQSLKTFVSVLDAVRKLAVAQARRVRKNGGAADDIVRVRVEGKCDVQRYDERGCVQVAGKQPGKNDTTRSQRQLKHLFSI